LICTYPGSPLTTDSVEKLGRSAASGRIFIQYINTVALAVSTLPLAADSHAFKGEQRLANRFGADCSRPEADPEQDGLLTLSKTVWRCIFAAHG
jgi:hypothetical protein